MAVVVTTGEGNRLHTLPAGRIRRSAALVLLLSVAAPAWGSHWKELGLADWDQDHPHKMVLIQYEYVAPYELPDMPSVGTAPSFDIAISKVELLNAAYARSMGQSVTEITVAKQPWRFISDTSGCYPKIRIAGLDKCADAGVVYQTYVSACLSPLPDCKAPNARVLTGSVIKRMYYNYVLDDEKPKPRQVKQSGGSAMR